MSWVRAPRWEFFLIFLGDALIHAWLPCISFLRSFMHHVMVLHIYYEPRVPESHAEPILHAPLAFGILKT